MKELGRMTWFSKGSEENLKITTVDDLRIFKALLHTKTDDWINQINVSEESCVIQKNTMMTCG